MKRPAFFIGALFALVLAWKLFGAAGIGGGGSVTITPGSGGGAGVIGAAGGIIFVASTGSDTAAGTAAAPMRTFAAATNRLGRSGTIIIRGGDYTNQSFNVANALYKIRGYPGEIINHIAGIGIPPASSVAVSNGIFAVTSPPSDFTNALIFWAALHNDFVPQNRWFYCYQTNQPDLQGTNVLSTARLSQGLMDKGPPIGLRQDDTNRLAHARLLHVNSIVSLYDQVIDLAAGQMTSSPDEEGSAITVTTNNHHFTAGQYVVVAGADQSTYNGTHLVRSVTDNTFTYWVGANPAATPATGTITTRRIADNCWIFTNNIYYWRPAVSNVVGGVMVASTNVSSSFIYGATAATDVEVYNIRSFFGAQGFDLTGVGRAELTGCLAYGSGYSGFYANNATAPAGEIRLLQCEGAAFNGPGGLHVIGRGFSGGKSPNVREEMCYWHDYLREGNAMRDGAVHLAIMSTCYGGRDAQFGFINDGATTFGLGLHSASNRTAAAQMGDVQGLASVSRYYSSVFESIRPEGQIAINDRNCHLWIVNCAFPTTTAAAVQTGNNTNQSVRAFGSYYFEGDNDPLINSADTASLNAANFQQGWVNYGNDGNSVGAGSYGTGTGLWGQNLYSSPAGTLNAYGASFLYGKASHNAPLEFIIATGSPQLVITNLPAGVSAGAAMPNGSLLISTNGIVQVRSNGAWVIK